MLGKLRRTAPEAPLARRDVAQAQERLLMTRLSRKCAPTAQIEQVWTLFFRDTAKPR